MFVRTLVPLLMIAFAPAASAGEIGEIQYVTTTGPVTASSGELIGIEASSSAPRSTPRSSSRRPRRPPRAP